ncbi:hypothetical protein BV898_14511 [Hypsibius exemplaris]|uniref:Uncharacterized protein n=1 Tax=Hypsibius exemplaris TaxID=2072580 RepID=A0A9X6NA72_HYPEX|nr:hypothetical protein BV898_14511 [Hypsibius exemplaris]
MGLTSLILVGCPTSFQITETLVIKYDSEAARDQYLPQLESNYRNALNEFQASNVKLTFISATDVPGSASIHLVQFRVTGQVVLPITDFAKVKTAVRQVLRDSHFSGIVDSEWDQYETVSVTDASDTSDTSASGGSSTSAVGGAGDASQQFETTDSISITYTSTTERDNILQQFVAFWTTALSSFQVTTVKITFVSEGAASSSSSSYKLVTYKVTASYSGSNKPDADTVKTTVHQAIQTAKLTGVEEQQAAFGAASGAAAAGSASAGDASAATYKVTNIQITFVSETPAARGNYHLVVQRIRNRHRGGAHTLETTDVAILTYTSVAQREQLLQQILAKWKAALSQFQLTTITIKFFSETDAVGGGKQVLYKNPSPQNGGSWKAVDGKTMKDRVKIIKQTVHTHHHLHHWCSGLSAQLNQLAFDMSNDNMDNHFTSDEEGFGGSSSQQIGTSSGQQVVPVPVPVPVLVLVRFRFRFWFRFWFWVRVRFWVRNEKVSGGGKQVVYKIFAQNGGSFKATDGLEMTERVKTIKTCWRAVGWTSLMSLNSHTAIPKSGIHFLQQILTVWTNALAPREYLRKDPRGIRITSGSKTITTFGSGSASLNGGNSDSMSGQLDVTDSADLTYSSTQERDDLLHRF